MPYYTITSAIFVIKNKIKRKTKLWFNVLSGIESFAFAYAVRLLYHNCLQLEIHLIKIIVCCRKTAACILCIPLPFVRNPEILFDEIKKACYIEFVCRGTLWR